MGAAGATQEGWLATDETFLDLLEERDWEQYFRERTLDAILAEHVWEHLTEEQGRAAASRCLRYLRPGGYLRLAVPDGLHPDPGYIAQVRPGGCGAGADDHKVLYDYRSLGRLLRETGFEPEWLEYFDEAGRFHFRDWSAADGWIRRSSRYDRRNTEGTLRYTSLLVDARRPR